MIVPHNVFWNYTRKFFLKPKEHIHWFTILINKVANGGLVLDPCSFCYHKKLEELFLLFRWVSNDNFLPLVLSHFNSQLSRTKSIVVH